MSFKIPLIVKILLSIIFPPIIPFWVILWALRKFLSPMIDFSKKENAAFSALVNNPNEANARAYIELYNNKPAATFLPDDNPNSWAVLREKWQIINHSSKIPSGMKKEIFGILTSRGLYVNNSNIINNFSGDDEMQRQQNEWAAEEARKAVTPFDHGGYMQGDGFNPSDTMAADAQRQMDNMNNMNNMGMF